MVFRAIIKAIRYTVDLTLLLAIIEYYLDISHVFNNNRCFIPLNSKFNEQVTTIKIIHLKVIRWFCTAPLLLLGLSRFCSEKAKKLLRNMPKSCSKVAQN